MHHLSRALATARVEELHRDAAQRHTILLAHGIAPEPRVAATSKVPIFGGWMRTGGRERVLPVTEFRRTER